MEYPSTWQLKPAENRFDRADVDIASSEGPKSGFIQIQYNILSEELTNMREQYGLSQEDLENNLDIFFPSFISGYSREIDSFNQIEDAKYEKYRIDGHKAGSVVYSFEISGMNLAGWVVVSLIGNKMFVFNYAADQNQFDANLPIPEYMLNSIRVLDK